MKRCSHPKQEGRHQAARTVCPDCGGRIRLFATELGNCDHCRREFYVATLAGEIVIRPIVDHRHDLV